MRPANPADELPAAQNSAATVATPRKVIHEERADDEIDLRELLQALYRHRLAIFGIFMLVVTLALLYLYQATPRYTAQAQLALDIRKSHVVDVQEVISGLSPNASVISTELDTIRSPALLERVVRQLHLHHDPAFNPALQPPDPDSLPEQVRAFLRSLWFLEGKPGETLSPEEQEQRELRSVIERLRNNLQVTNPRNSYTIRIEFTADSPRRAAEIANTLAELYLTEQLEAKFEATRRANEWLSERLEGLRLEVQAAEQAVKNVRERGGIIEARGGTILQQQLSDINAQLVEARVKVSRADARLRSAREVMNRPGGIETIGEVIDSRTIQQLRSEESNLRRKRAELSQRFGPRYPEMIQVEAELKDLQEKLNEEVARIIQSLENELRIARAGEQALQRSLSELRSEAGQSMEVELELMQLERMAESARAVYQNFLGRFQETRDQGELQRTDARIIAMASIPLEPSAPKKNVILMVSATLGMLLGIVAAFLLEALDRGYRTAGQLEAATGLPVLGMIPLLGRFEGTPLEYLKKKPFSMLAESLRNIKAAIQMSHIDQPPKTVLITSSLPSEGKSSTAMALARSAAQAGSKTILIDADLRLPTIAKAFPAANFEVRLEDVLQGESHLDRAIVKDPDSNLSILAAHGKTPTIAEMLGSQRMKALLSKLEEHYDLVIIDSPPSMGISDTWDLAKRVDAVVLVVRWAETPRDTVQAALHNLYKLDIPVTGIIMTMVNMKKQSAYGYAAEGYYYAKYHQYYHKKM